MPMTAQQFEQIYQYCAQYYQIDITKATTHVYYRGQALLTSALDYVTREYIPHGYLLTGHGEAALSEVLSELLGNMELDVEELDLNVAQAVPADANCLVLFAPASDLSAHETALIKDYLNAGGSLLLNTSPETVQSCPNLLEVCGLFGLSAAPGVVEEGDTSYILGSRFSLLPTVNTEHNVGATLSANGAKALMPNSHAITVAETLPAGVAVTPLLTTSATANRVAVDDPALSLGTAGKLHVAVTAAKSISRPDGTATAAYLTWFGSADAITDTVAESVSGGNYYYYAASLSSMSVPFVSAYEGLAAVDLSGASLAISDGPVFLLGALAVLVIPAGLLTAGIVIWVRRKRR
jgi:ABC-2 type transport system permease protein